MPFHARGGACAAVVCWAVALLAVHAGACPADHGGRPVLGAYRTPPETRGPVLILVQQAGIDVEVVAGNEAASEVIDGPGGRNGIEWVYLEGANANQTELCFYALHHTAAANAYSVSLIDLSGLTDREKLGFKLMSRGGSLWALHTPDATGAAIATYDQVADWSIVPLALSEYARLYAAKARAQRYQYDQVLTGLARLREARPESAFVRFQAQWLTGIVFVSQGDWRGAELALRSAYEIAVGDRRNPGIQTDLVDIKNTLGEVQLSAGNLDAGEQLVKEALVEAAGNAELLGLVHNNLGYVELRRADLGPAADRRERELLLVGN